MGFEVIPAVDVFDGRLARLSDGGVAFVEAFDGDPVVAARSFVEAGARWIHVVDMDLALGGEFRNLDVVAGIAGLGVSVQASGGITGHTEVERALASGAGRVVLASSALSDRAAVEALLARHGDALAVGIESDRDMIRGRARQEVGLPLLETMAWLAGLDVDRYVHTSVSRVGGLEGPDLDAIGAVIDVTGRPVVASGGIRGPEDLRRVAAIGAHGAILGRALYEGLDLRDALAAVA
ncbi:MAG: bifunctional 1-(5-phosphoribosyl)-5-((5-phosphoribosylamino)methylideneamino)imidazole-4-carboxamide isomerase/phosphoribosylanthranilate isomerase PriA [Actinobacteria bacterium]|nr:MAG: bifunctional 1-(5-phosphoribosyl)-5-((5-phosphoribosylamino)methylideneamino)imidazole-4-carboxamide isomerase/phosphoribosylanthranilate isomerase PriA [Actinomycetota bacterium]